MRILLSTWSVLLLTIGTLAQETLYGLPPIPGEPIPTTTQPPSSTHRLFRFGPFIPFIPFHELPAHHDPLHHPTLPPQLAHPFDPYNNINPVPELPPQPENKYNGYYDLDGNFVAYGSEGALGLNSRGRPKRAAGDLDDEVLNQRLLEEELAYDELDEQTKTTPKPKLVTSFKTPGPRTNLPSRPVFVSGNARSRTGPSSPSIVDKSVVQKTQNVARVSNKLPIPRQNAKHVATLTTTGRPMHANKVVTSTRKHKKSRLLDLEEELANVFFRTRTLKPTYSTRKPKDNFRPKQQLANRPRPLPTGGQRSNLPPRQSRPQPLQIAPQSSHRPQQAQVQQFVPRVPIPQPRSWAAPLAVDTRDPTVIAYLKDVEDYDWQYAGERPDLDLPARLLRQEQIAVTPETLVPLGNGGAQGTLVGTTVVPTLAATPSFTAPPPAAVTQPNPYTLAPQPSFAAAPGPDLLGIFGGTPHPLFDLRRLFGGLGGGRR